MYSNIVVEYSVNTHLSKTASEHVQASTKLSKLEEAAATLREPLSSLDDFLWWNKKKPTRVLVVVYFFSG